MPSGIRPTPIFIYTCPTCRFPQFVPPDHHLVYTRIGAIACVTGHFKKKTEGPFESLKSNFVALFSIHYHQNPPQTSSPMYLEPYINYKRYQITVLIPLPNIYLRAQNTFRTISFCSLPIASFTKIPTSTVTQLYKLLN